MSSLIPLSFLSKSNFGNISDIKTFTTLCQDNKDKYPTDAWLIPNIHKYSMLTKIVTANMAGKEFIIKIQQHSKVSEREMAIYEAIDEIKHPNFAELVCHFSCNDNILLYNRQSSLPKGFCNGGADGIHLTIMPYYKLGNIEDYKLDQNALSPIIGQVILGYVEMFNAIGFIHNDLIPGNVAIEKDHHKFIEYQFKENKYIVRLQGLRSIILDFGASIISKDESSVVRDLLLFIEKIFRIKHIDFIIDEFIDRSKPIKSITELLQLAVELKFIELI